MEVRVVFDINGPDGKECFRRFDDGQYQMGKPIVTRHPNLVRSVIIGKKGWGLWSKEWSEGIGEGSFQIDEILEEFKNRDINIPECFRLEFQKKIEKHMSKK